MKIQCRRNLNGKQRNCQTRFKKSANKNIANKIEKRQFPSYSGTHINPPPQLKELVNPFCKESVYTVMSPGQVVEPDVVPEEVEPEAVVAAADVDGMGVGVVGTTPELAVFMVPNKLVQILKN